MTALSVRGLTKRYPAFSLEGVNFSLEEGKICGLAGANGAGKTTLLKGITGQISVAGEVRIFGMPNHDLRTKTLVGYAGGGFRFYPRKKVSSVAKAVSRFYSAWNESQYKKYLEKFEIDQEKKISELSEGMKVKFALTLALSHGARIIILDEPTSGLDPYSREDFCDCMFHLAREEGVAVLFSTHIASDLTGVADDIVYLSAGKAILNEPLDQLLKRYRLACFGSPQEGVIGLKEGKDGFKGLIPRDRNPVGAVITEPTLDEIIICLETERRKQCPHS